MTKRKLRRLETDFNNLHYQIEEALFYSEEGDVLVWAYLYVYDGDNCIEDRLQDDVEMCVKYAHDYDQVPKESWSELACVFEEDSMMK